MVLIQGSYGPHPIGNVMLEVNNNTLRLEQSSNLLVTDVFTGWLLVSFVSYVLIL